MKENIISKINKIGKVANIVLKIFRIITIIAMVAILIATVVFAVMPKDFLKLNFSGEATVEIDVKEIGVSLSESNENDIRNELSVEDDIIELNGLDYAMDSVEVEDDVIIYNASAQTRTVHLKNLFVLMIAAFIFLGTTLISTIFAGKMCKALKDCETPFEDSVIKSMQKFGYSLIPWPILSSVVDSIADSFFSGTINIGLSIDLSLVLAIIVVILLSYIFKYGAMLQLESDETL